MTLYPNAKKAAYDAALPALNRNAAPFHVIDLAIEAYIASRPSAIVEEPVAVDGRRNRVLELAGRARSAELTNDQDAFNRAIQSLDAIIYPSPSPIRAEPG